jgi:hypothetical protein
MDSRSSSTTTPPPGSGLGSSSAVTVALVSAMAELLRLPVDAYRSPRASLVHWNHRASRGSMRVSKSWAGGYVNRQILDVTLSQFQLSSSVKAHMLVSWFLRLRNNDSWWSGEVSSRSV